MGLFTTKKELKATIKRLEERIERLLSNRNDLLEQINLSNTMWEAERNKYPFELGQVVYDVQLRNAKGRYTKHNAAREYSKINEVVVDKKNYFNLVDRMASGDVFTSLELAQEKLDAVCVPAAEEV